MKIHKSVIDQILVAGTVCLVAAAASGATPRRMQMVDFRGETFTVSTKFSGILAKTLEVGGAKYQMSPSTTIYVVGKGVVPQGSAVSNATLYLSGKQVGSEMVVTQILVREQGASPQLRSGQSDVGIVAPGTPS